jgi:hypothetical protein
MQIWPVWIRSMYGSSDLSWRVIMNEGVTPIPRVLATKIKVGGEEVPVSGFYYVTYSRGSDHSCIEDFFKAVITREFKLLYIKEIIRECHSHDWYKNIIQNERACKRFSRKPRKRSHRHIKPNNHSPLNTPTKPPKPPASRISGERGLGISIILKIPYPEKGKALRRAISTGS